MSRPITLVPLHLVEERRKDAELRDALRAAVRNPWMLVLDAIGLICGLCASVLAVLLLWVMWS